MQISIRDLRVLVFMSKRRRSWNPPTLGGCGCGGDVSLAANFARQCKCELSMGCLLARSVSAGNRSSRPRGPGAMYQ